LNCREFTEFMMAYLERELPKAQRTSFEEHIRDCPPCLAYLDSYKETVALGKRVCELEDEAPADVPEPLIQAILRARER